jgi:hydrogenase maturation factor
MTEHAMQDTHISLAHGNGGRFMRELIDEIFARHLANDRLDVQVDAASLLLESRDIIFSTDGLRFSRSSFREVILAHSPFMAQPMTWPWLVRFQNF